MGVIKKLNKKKIIDILYVYVYYFYLKLMYILVCWFLMVILCFRSIIMYY